MIAGSAYATPRLGVARKDCWFYHSIDLPGEGFVKGHWDLREKAGEYLGNVDFTGQRVLEVGPASGFLTAWMEQHGADVVALEQPETAVWDWPPLNLNDPGWQARESAKIGNNDQLKNSFWFTHEKLNLSAKALYRQIDDIPDEVGEFDIAVLAMVLTHMRDPAKAIEVCARRAKKKLIITERLHVTANLQDQPVLWYVPKPGVERYDTWWFFSRGYFDQILKGIGYRTVSFSNFTVDVNGKQYPTTAIVAEW